VVKVACCIPLDWEWMPKNFAMSLLGIQSHAYRSGEYEVKFYYGRYINFGRQKLAEAVLKDNMDYIFWIDADQVYPEDAISVLLKRDKDIVGGLTGKRSDGTPCVWNFVTPEEQAMFRRTQKLKQLNTKANTGLQKADCIGMGGILTKIDVFKKVPSPWFQTIYVDAGGDARGLDSIGEDVYFYEKVKAAGDIEVYSDTDLIYGHISQKVIFPR